MAGTFILFRPFFLSGGDLLPGDLSDSRLNHLFLEHFYQSLAGNPVSRYYWSPQWIYFPHPNALAYSDNLLGTAWIYAAVRWFTDPYDAFIAWIFVVAIANYAAFYWMARVPLRATMAAAIIGAYLFAFGMPRLAQIGHLQLLPQFFTPLCVGALVIALEQRSLVALAASVGCLVGQIYAGVYLGWFAAVGFVAAAPFVLMYGWRTSKVSWVFEWVKSTYVWFALIFAAAILALVPLAGPYGRAKAEVGVRPFASIYPMVPRWASYFMPHPGSLLAPLEKLAHRVPASHHHEHYMFPGFVAYICLAWVLLRARSELRNDRHLSIVAVIAGRAVLVVILATTMFVEFTLWGYLYDKIPGGSAIRALTRICLLCVFLLSICVSSVVDDLVQRRRWWFVGILSCVLVTENWAKPYFALSRQEAHTRITALDTAACPVFLLQDPKGNTYTTQLDAMWLSMLSKKPTLNGYSAWAPPDWPFGNPVGSTAAIDRWFEHENYPKPTVCIIER